MNHLLWHSAIARAEEYGDCPAVEDANGTLTYAQLAADSGRFAARLGSWGVGSGDRVALWLPKSTRAVTAMLGTSRAGAAYVPVDPATPPARAATIIGNAAARVLVTTARLLGSIAGGRGALPDISHIILVGADHAADEDVMSWRSALSLDAPVPTPHSVETDPAYILYTSGSTGTPKGVVISHRNALTFIDWAAGLCAVQPGDRLSNHAPLHFDLSVFDIYVALQGGACVLLVPDGIAPFPMELARWIEEKQITIWYSVPSALIRLHGHGQLGRFAFGSVRIVLFAGEVFPVRHLREVMAHFPAARFFNLYGPTETNVCTYYPVPRPLPEGVADLPIGHACANFDAFAMTAEGHRVQVGAEGELVVRGPGVMLGYWGLPERTRESLAQNPLHDDYTDLVYRTGDIVRVEPDGSFAFLGRRDHMVKTRGYRVELGEIEYVLHQHEAVGSAVVVAVPDEEFGARLWAAIVPAADESVTGPQLASHCMERLPRYAVPERFCMVRELPHTSTGKIDRQSLLQSLLQTLQVTSTAENR
jgi:amino acid adenylation domain-containing protein